MQEASKKLSLSLNELDKFLRKDDKRKQDYYHRFTGGEWTDATNYDLCLDSSKLGYEKCLEEIEYRINMMMK